MELSTTTFMLIIAGYVVGGLLLGVLGATGLGARTPLGRVASVLGGVACLAYAGYLFFSPSDTVWVFWYPMLLPFIVAFKAVRVAVVGNRRTA